MRDYDAIHVIQNSGLPKNAASVLVRSFNKAYEAQEPDGCISNSAVNCVCLAYLGFNPVLRLGQIEVDERPFYHAWTELDGKIIDLAVYGNTHFPPFGDLLPSVMPQVNKEYGHADVSYYPDKFDDDFSSWGGHITLGMNMADYMDNAPKRNALWNMALYCLDMSPTADNLRKLKATASKYTIGKSV